jgi:hypothetical protein
LTTQPHPPETSSRYGGYVVVGAIFLASAVLAVWFTLLLARSEETLWDSQLRMQQSAPNLDVDGCVDWVMEWRKNCSALQSLCDVTVDPLIVACMDGADRKPWCADVKDWTGTTGFEFAHCDRRQVQATKPAKGFWDRMLFGGGRQTPERKVCAASYRAVADYCQDRKLVEVL